MTITRQSTRFEDMSPRGHLRLLQQEDGDIIVAIVPDPDEPPVSIWSVSCEFCTMPGGGQSPKVLMALRNLMDAMDEENLSRPQNRIPDQPVRPNPTDDGRASARPVNHVVGQTLPEQKP